MRRFGLVFVILSLTISAVAACASDAATEAAVEPSATSAAIPTFTRVTVTPVPKDTPQPTSAPEPSFTAEQLAYPIFPDWLDPELNDVQPEDDVVFEGWVEFLTNTVVQFTGVRGGGRTVNFCENGVVIDETGAVDTFVVWAATRTAAMSSSEWGMIALTATFNAGENQGLSYTVLSFLGKAAR